MITNNIFRTTSYHFRSGIVYFEKYTVQIKYKNPVNIIPDQFGLNFGKLGQPIRVALTGGPVSPPIDVTAELVGRERALRRLDSALEIIAARVAASR